MKKKIWFVLSIFITVVLFIASNFLIQSNLFLFFVFRLCALLLTINIVFMIIKAKNVFLWMMAAIMVTYFSLMFYDMPFRIVLCARYLGMTGACSLKVSEDCFPMLGIKKKETTIIESIYPMNIRKNIFGVWCSSI